MLRTIRSTVAVLAVLLLGAAALRAQDAASRTLLHPGISGYAEVSIADKYIYHGYIAEDRGPVIQPYVELFGTFYESKGAGLIDSASVRLSVFNSVQPGDHRVDQDMPLLRAWYETQIEAGLELMFANHLTFTASYRRFESPNGAFGSSDGVAVRLAADDREWLGAFALHPSIVWIAPLPTDSSSDSESGHYLEARLEPGTTFAAIRSLPVSVSLPVAVGFGDARYYFGRHFGFLSVGVAATVPLKFIPAGFGEWKFGASATYFYLGDTAAEFTNGGSRSTAVVAATVSTSF